MCVSWLILEASETPVIISGNSDDDDDDDISPYIQTSHSDKSYWLFIYSGLSRVSPLLTVSDDLSYVSS